MAGSNFSAIQHIYPQRNAVQRTFTMSAWIVSLELNDNAGLALTTASHVESPDLVERRDY